MGISKARKLRELGLAKNARMEALRMAIEADPDLLYGNEGESPDFEVIQELAREDVWTATELDEAIFALGYLYGIAERSGESPVAVAQMLGLVPESFPDY